MPTRQFVAPFGEKGVPADWTLPASLEIIPRLAWAHFDGSSAAGAFLPCLRLISDSGHIACEAVSEIQVAAGASADVSWFQGADLDEAQGTGATVGVTVETVFYDTPNANTPLAMSTVLQSGVSYVLIAEGTYSLWNEALGIGHPNAEAQFPDSHSGRVSTQVGLDVEALFAYPSDKSDVIGHSTLWTMSLDGGVTYSHIEPVGGPFATPQTGNLYRYELTGQGNALHIKLNDINPPDNYGKMKFTLQLPNGTGTGSGAGQLVPPTDATLNGDVLAVLNGIPTFSAVDGGSP